MKVKRTSDIFMQEKSDIESSPTLVLNGNVPRAKHYLQKAENFLIKRTSQIKKIVKTEYLFSVSIFTSLQKCKHRSEWPLNS